MITSICTFIFTIKLAGPGSMGCRPHTTWIVAAESPEQAIQVASQTGGRAGEGWCPFEKADIVSITKGDVICYSTKKEPTR